MKTIILFTTLSYLAVASIVLLNNENSYAQATKVAESDQIEFEVVATVSDLRELPLWLRKDLIEAGASVPDGPTIRGGKIDFEKLLGKEKPKPFKVGNNSK